MASSQFSSNEAVSLQKEIHGCTNKIETNPDDLNNVYEILKCIDWIQKNNFKKVCLQFPDHLLNDSTEVALCLQDNLKQVVYIMGDTAYESCCVDYVAAAHVNADAIIHYGPVCFSKPADNIPCLYIYEKHPLDIVAFKETVCNCTQYEDAVVVIDTPFIVHIDRIKDACSGRFNVHSVAEEGLSLSNRSVLFIGNVLRKITNLYFSFKPKQLFYYDPKALTQIINYEQDIKVLKRRNFLIEKIKDSNTIGIVIGTVAVRNYLSVIERVKRLIAATKKKYYVISVGKPAVAKLANFPEIDVFVVIACAMNEIYESRDFYKPFVTPFDIEMALNPAASDIHFSYDYNDYLPDGDLSENDLAHLSRLEQNDVSLLTGKIRNSDTLEDSSDNRMALKADGTVSINSFGAGFLSERSWKGLEQNLGSDEPEIASEGRCGLAQSYTNEK